MKSFMSNIHYFTEPNCIINWEQSIYFYNSITNYLITIHTFKKYETYQIVSSNEVIIMYI